MSLLAEARRMRLVELDWQHWYVEQHPLNRRFYPTPRPRPVHDEAEHRKVLLPFSSDWDAFQPWQVMQAEVGRVGLLGCWYGCVPIRVARVLSPFDFHAERMDDPEPSRGETRKAWIRCMPLLALQYRLAPPEFDWEAAWTKS